MLNRMLQFNRMNQTAKYSTVPPLALRQRSFELCALLQFVMRLRARQKLRDFERARPGRLSAWLVVAGQRLLHFLALPPAEQPCYCFPGDVPL